MIERVVENWLTNASERSMEVPFCQLLVGEGYEVVHLSRHGEAEEGKDILAIDPDGVPCAFQLKATQTGKITLAAWERSRAQAVRLVEIPIKHPSIDEAAPRKVFWVTNGELDGPVRLEIEHRNPDWERRGHPPLQTILKGQLLRRFVKLNTDFWPVELTSERMLLELFLADGTGCLDKGKLADFVLSVLPLTKNRPGKAECRRALASAAVLTCLALSPYTRASNHVAIIEGWVVYLACLVALVERCALDRRYWKDSFSISTFAIEGAFDGLCDELKTRSHLVEGNALVDGLFYRCRVTWLVGLASAYVLWRRFRDPAWPIDRWFASFVRSHLDKLLLWGEAAVPQFLATIWFLRQIVATPEPDRMLRRLIHSVCRANEAEHSLGLPDPYQDLSSVVSQYAAEEIAQETTREMIENALGRGLPHDLVGRLSTITREQIHIIAGIDRPYYRGRSFTLQSLVELYVRRGWRQRLRWLWPRITRLHFAEYRPPFAWQLCLWRQEADGELRDSEPEMTQSWAQLRHEASQTDLARIPKLFQEHPELLLLFIIVYPHRLTPDVAKFLDDQIADAKRRAYRSHRRASQRSGT